MKGISPEHNSTLYQFKFFILQKSIKLLVNQGTQPTFGGTHFIRKCIATTTTSNLKLYVDSQFLVDRQSNRTREKWHFPQYSSWAMVVQTK